MEYFITFHLTTPSSVPFRSVPLKWFRFYSLVKLSLRGHGERQNADPSRDHGPSRMESRGQYLIHCSMHACGTFGRFFVIYMLTSMCLAGSASCQTRYILRGVLDLPRSLGSWGKNTYRWHRLDHREHVYRVFLNIHFTVIWHAWCCLCTSSLLYHFNMMLPDCIDSVLHPQRHGWSWNTKFIDTNLILVWFFSHMRACDFGINHDSCIHVSMWSLGSIFISVEGASSSTCFS